MDYIIEMDLNQVVKFPTRQENFLDLIFTSSPDSFREIDVIEPLHYKESISDHYGIEFDFHFPVQTKSSKFIKDFHSCNYEDINQFLFSIDWNLAFSGCTDIDSLYHVFRTIILEVIENFVLVKRINSNVRKLPLHIKKMIEYRRKLLKNLTNVNFSIAN